jgi:hypothetical protein
MMGYGMKRSSKTVVITGLAALLLTACAQAEPKAAGPLCTPVSREAFASQPIRTKYDFDYDALTFSRAFGHMECNEVKDVGLRMFLTYPVCTLTGPGVLKIKSQGVETYYLPGVGRPVTVSLHEGKLTCSLDPIQ